MNEISPKLAKYKYIFIGEQHGRENISKGVFSLIHELKGKIIFCVELPQEVESLLKKCLEGEIEQEVLFASPYLEDALHDKRFHQGVLELYTKLHEKEVIIHCLEDYSGTVEERDKNMAKKFLEIIEKEKAEHYILYTGNVHVMKEEGHILGFHVTPILIYLPKQILSEAITLQLTEKDGFVHCELE